MCGRVFLSTDGDAIAAVLGLVHDGRATGLPCADVPPTAVLPVAAVGRSGPLVTGMRWGLVPSWWKQPKRPTQTFNARRETLAEAPSFRHLLERRRAVVAVTGFYEWTVDPSGTGRARKVRHAVRDGAGGLLWMAGLWDAHRDADGSPKASVTIITQPSAGPLIALHARMPWRLTRSEVAAWIDPEVSWTEASRLGASPPPVVVANLQAASC